MKRYDVAVRFFGSSFEEMCGYTVDSSIEEKSNDVGRLQNRIPEVDQGLFRIELDHIGQNLANSSATGSLKPLFEERKQGKQGEAHLTDWIWYFDTKN